MLNKGVKASPMENERIHHSQFIINLLKDKFT